MTLNSSKSIFLQPINGLGNRLRLIQSYYKLCVFTKRNLKVFWSVSPGFSNAKFEDLFDLDSINRSVISFISEKDFLKARAKNLILDNYILQSESLDYSVKDKSNIIDKLLNDSLTFKGSICPNYIFNKEKNVNNIYRKFNNNCFISALQPNKNLQNEINKISNSFDSNTLGVHIRRGDAVNSPWKDKYLFSSDQMFFEKIKNHKSKVFLSTDCEITQSKILSEFGDKIIYNFNKKFNDSKQSHLDFKPFQKCGVIDMYCLSRCENIIGTNWSSFSEVSSCIGKGNENIK